MLERSWDQNAGTDPLNWRKVVYRPEGWRFVLASWTICSISTSFATCPWKTNVRKLILWNTLISQYTWGWGSSTIVYRANMYTTVIYWWKNPKDHNLYYCSQNINKEPCSGQTSLGCIIKPIICNRRVNASEVCPHLIIGSTFEKPCAGKFSRSSSNQG